MRPLTLPLKLAPHCSALVDGRLFASVQLGVKPVKKAACGTKVGSSTPRGGMPGKPGKVLGWKRFVKLCGPGRKFTPIGKKGAEKERLSTAPRSSRTL